MLRCHFSSVELRQYLMFASWRLTTVSIFTCEVSGGVDTASCNGEQPWQAFHNDWCHLSSFHLLFQSGGQMPRVCQETVSPRCLFEEVLLALDKLTGCFCLLLAWVETRISIMISQQVVKLQDLHHNLCWHGDQTGLPKQLILMKLKTRTVRY